MEKSSIFSGFLPFLSDEILFDSCCSTNGTAPLSPSLSRRPSPRLAAGRRQTHGGPSPCPFSCSCASSLPTDKRSHGLWFCHLSYLKLAACPTRPAVFGFARYTASPVTTDIAPSTPMPPVCSSPLFHSLTPYTILRRPFLVFVVPLRRCLVLTQRFLLLGPPASSLRLLPNTPHPCPVPFDCTPGIPREDFGSCVPWRSRCGRTR